MNKFKVYLSDLRIVAHSSSVIRRQYSTPTIHDKKKNFYVKQTSGKYK